MRSSTGIIIKMSVDVFGRKLDRGEATPGPPGIGFKFTAEGHYDIENKKLCNIAEPQEPSDGVNLKTVQSIVQMEVRGMTDITTRLRSSLDDLDIIIDNHRDEIDAEFARIKADILTIKEVMAQLISQ